MEMLSRVEQEMCDPDSDDAEPDLSERLDGLDLDESPEKVWERLSEKEKNEFENLLKAGKLNTLVEIWTPWWTVKNDSLVTDLEQESKQFEGRPRCLGTIPDIRQLLKNSKPSADVKYNMVNVLYSYAFIARLHNGEHVTFCLDSSKELSQISDVLGKNVVCSSAPEAIQLCLLALTKGEHLQSSQDLRLSTVQSVIDIIQGPDTNHSLDYIMAALSDSLSILQNSRKIISRGIKKTTLSKQNGSDQQQFKKKLFQMEKKVEFLLSWTQRFGMVMQTLIPEIKLEQCVVLDDEEEVKATKEKFEKKWGGKVQPPKKKLIEEIT
ncbi:hypothetical protein ScPMuIL_002396 [Solemya velum]